jgi:hypothetical protein
MPILEIKLNDKMLYRVGGLLTPQIGVYVGNTQQSDIVKVSANGYRETDPHTSEHRSWPKVELTKNDEITISLVDNGEITEPSECSSFNHSSNLEDLQKRVAEMIAKHRIEGKGPHPLLDKEQLSKSPHFCSFCSKHSSEVKHLIARSIGLYL